LNLFLKASKNFFEGKLLVCDFVHHLETSDRPS